MPDIYDLFCNEGPMAGERIRLVRGEKLPIGRSKNGLHLPDPLVGLEHAVIEGDGESWWVTDLGSTSGTFVDDKRIKRDEKRRLRPGNRIRIGESTFEIQLRSEWPAWAAPLIALLLFIAILSLYAAIVYARPVTYSPTLTWSAPVHQGTVVSPTVDIPISFIRREGIDHRDLSIRRVSDGDHDGTDELWLVTSAGERIVVTFGAPDAAGTPTWDVIGRLPATCVERDTSTFPEQLCGQLTWRVRDGKYVPDDVNGKIVWMRPLVKPATGPTPRSAPPDTPFEPISVGTIDPQGLAGFLAARGVEEPVHYVICEEALTGLRAQALTESGEIVALDYGCIGEVDAAFSDTVFRGDEDPVAFATTAYGVQSLGDDIAKWLTGDIDATFGNDHDFAILRAIRQDAIVRPMAKVTFALASLANVDPVAKGVPPGRPTGHALLGDAKQLGRPSAPTGSVTIEGATQVDPPGCSILEIYPSEWQCLVTHLCMPNQQFVRVDQVGCERRATIASAPYGGVTVGGDPDVEVRVQVDARADGGTSNALRAKVSWRERPK